MRLTERLIGTAAEIYRATVLGRLLQISSIVLCVCIACHGAKPTAPKTDRVRAPTTLDPKAIDA